MSSVKSLVPMAISGGVGALVGRAVPQFIPVLKDMGTTGSIISKLLLAFGGAMLIDKTRLDKKLPMIFSADGWVVGSVASGVADATSVGIVSTMQGLGMIPGNLAPYRPGMGEFVTMDGDQGSPFADEGVYAG